MVGKKKRDGNGKQGSEVMQSKEEGFDLNNCFDGAQELFEKFYIKDKDYYFDSYAHYGIHEEMLKDDIRFVACFNHTLTLLIGPWRTKTRFFRTSTCLRIRLCWMLDVEQGF